MTTDPNEWKEAVLDELAMVCMDFPIDASPREIIKAIIAMNVTMATDPILKPPTKTQLILTYCQIPRTSVEVKLLFGDCKSLLTALRQAGCITATRKRLESPSRGWYALYEATGKPYVARRGRKPGDPSSPKYKASLAYEEKNRERRGVYFEAYRKAKRALVNADKRASAKALRAERKTKS